MSILSRIFRRAEPQTERRASGSGFTAEIMAARASYISGRSGLGELTAAVQTCVGLWEGALAASEVTGTDLLRSRDMALCARALALRGESVWLIDGDRLRPAHDWDLSTRNGEPRAYRLSIADTGGSVSRTALAAEVLHFTTGSDPSAPWSGSAPLRRASISGDLLHALESALAEVFAEAPLGSQIVPFPEAPETDAEALARGFRGKRGRVLLRESVAVTAAGGPAPALDWRPSQVSPHLRDSMAHEALEAARAAICNVFGVLPALLSGAVTGPAVREAQRHLATWALQPLARQIAEECTDKLGAPVNIDIMRPLQAYDAGGRARALGGVLSAMAEAKAGGVSQAEIEAAMRFAGVPQE